MFELINLLDTVYRTISADLEAWFEQFPQGVAWNVISDYCIGDLKKSNDTFAFAIVLNHDTQANIAEYIAAVAPSDIKGSRSASEGLVAYLGSPVVFSVTYLVEKKSKLLRDYITDDNIRGALGDMREVVSQMVAMIPERSSHYREVDKRLSSFQTEMKRRARNSNLARQILLCAAFASIVCRHLAVKKKPKFIRWISDRDAMFDKHDKVAFDLAFLYFHLHRMMNGHDALEPQFLFGLPGWDGKNEYAEFIRAADYLAGTLADIKLPEMTFSHAKFEPVFHSLFVNGPNAAIVEVLARDGGGLTARRLVPTAPVIT
ncbi:MULTISPECIES: hypothetical protein [Rhizobiaceae]|uniref:hypothetical protein n=1 Tax=Rhizobiaceae TaxID=82115 RepID=UPI0003C534BE|nr:MULTISPECIES: hypothetical protein [Hyphomicrobiales]EYR78490.1 hypothetical protein SHLA_72c000160 [Shinella sp. DD12]MCA0345257.1 hypothetical protein [Pseudomonadota bacterium]VVS99162.1 conserved hypothetical protein [Hoeflea sp. EC-HK425]